MTMLPSHWSLAGWVAALIVTWIGALASAAFYVYFPSIAVGFVFGIGILVGAGVDPVADYFTKKHAVRKQRRRSAAAGGEKQAGAKP